MAWQKAHWANILARSGFSLDEKPTNKTKMLQEKLLQLEGNLSEPESYHSAGPDLCAAGWATFQL